MLKPPHPHSNAYKVAMLIFNNGSMTLDQGIVFHGLFGESRSKTKVVYDAAINHGWLTEEFNVYSLTKTLMNYYFGCLHEPVKRQPQAIVPHRLVNMWTPEMKPVKAHPRIRQDFSPITFSGRPA